MKLLLTVIVLALTSPLFSQSESLLQDAITKPSLSLRCQELFRERNEKIKVQQRLNSLLQRNESLLRKTPENKTSLRARLSSLQIRLKNELHLTTLQIATMEENIVRSGCPGLSL